MQFIKKHKWIFFIIVSIVGFILDVGSKYIAVASLIRGRMVPVVGDFMQWQLVYNTGAIFGLDPSKWISGFPVNLFFYIFNAFAIILLVIYYKNLEDEARFSFIGISLIMPGALGNLFDRVFYPSRGVVDFIRIGISEKIYWPIFNIADIYISVGVVLIIIDLWLIESKNKKDSLSLE